MKKAIPKYDKAKMAHLTQPPRLNGQQRNAGLRAQRKPSRRSGK